MIYFVHVPKTAGSFIKSCYGSYSNFRPNTRSDKEHKFPRRAKRLGFTCEAWRRAPDIDSFPSYLDDVNYQKADFSFSIVRNPFDWLVSYYHHSSRYDNGWANVNDTHGFKTFKQFVEGFATMPSDDWHVPFLSENPFGQVLMGDSLMVDKYFRQENLDELFEYLLDNFNMSKKASGKINRSAKRKDLDYKKYYDQEMIDLVYDKMGAELEYFGYGFDEVQK